MIKRLTLLFLACSVMLTLTVSANAAQKFILDEQHTYVLWHIKHLGFSSQSGKWYAKGFIILDKDSPEKSQVEATINVANVVTGIPELDKHLKGKLFFDVARYPTATFVSNKIDVTNKTSAKVSGILTLHGISKPIVLTVTFNKEGKNPITDKPTVGFTATSDIKRSDFGMNTMLPDIGDGVTLDIDAEAYQANP